MKTIGLIGGMSWESSLEYYRIINEETRKRLGGLHSAKSLMYSVDFAEIEKLQHRGDWEAATRMMVDAAKHLENGGADFVLICTNTMHKMAKDVENAISIPLLHIADPTAESIKTQRLTKVALLGTKYTMEQDFYKGRLTEKFGLSVIIPNETDRQTIHDIIYDELCLGNIDIESKKKFIAIIEKLQKAGAQGVVLGCTEIGLLIQQQDVTLPAFDTTHIHAAAAVNLALK
ncbi:aspartate/glutamate racemase family protein [Candidatus Saccharibacteria bacterium]|mgnify:CR=1 FL=1|nr:aspartate/glutamate racemase family protein [Candidatus Saccharibacteria bacterium]